jgi:hypothetical protein
VKGRADHGWCSLRLRFDDRELGLLRGAEQVRGASLAHHARPDLLRDALSLSRAGAKLAHARPGTATTLDESEVKLLVDAIRFATGEIHWVSDQAARQPGTSGERQTAVLNSFPELAERGLWRSYAVCRDLDGLAARLQKALSATSH